MKGRRTALLGALVLVPTALLVLVVAGEWSRTVLTPGLKVREPGATGGYTLYSTLMSPVAHLQDEFGTDVHTWSLPAGYADWVNHVELTSEGTLLGVAGAGKGENHLIELDWDSNVLWMSRNLPHHDWVRLPNGNTLMLSLTSATTTAGGDHPSRRGQSDRAPLTLKEDRIIEETLDNEIVWEWRTADHLEELFALLGTREFTGFVQEDDESFTVSAHPNSLEVLPDTPLGRVDPRFRAGNLLTSYRSINTIAIIDRDTGKFVWAFGPGVLLRQHQPTMLPSGNLLVYDNGSSTLRPYTRIVELEPLTGRIVWEYRPPGQDVFYSRGRGGAQPLPGGNLLVTESERARIFEINRAGDLLWEYQVQEVDVRARRAFFASTERHITGKALKFLYRATRYSADEIDRLRRVAGAPPLTPSPPRKS